MKNIKLENDEIAIIWSVDDVLQECDWLTREEALDVLHSLEHNHDSCIGINWEVINAVADMRYPEND